MWKHSWGLMDLVLSLSSPFLEHLGEMHHCSAGGRQICVPARGWQPVSASMSLVAHENIACHLCQASQNLTHSEGRVNKIINPCVLTGRVINRNKWSPEIDQDHRGNNHFILNEHFSRREQERELSFVWWENLTFTETLGLPWCNRKIQMWQCGTNEYPATN
jgi:hypothetical protein